ncbi:LytR/AlgR family response regulator transcription factor [Flavivirga spongiicola]|uniref:LytTR family DNA-binding domain-containing protein n=1 Tax=Flavivirga spongiicola TaxID=421621 RepID=A0ABU7XSX3_9FLAO|nr:LytTR family DNA-binding domain-containing protein [Flavivirga sp. MEBiC05379]MDO5977957.1 LytTR family DNA-binding domain-containing protein [Flavivirga sp. MEBiC05379]
MIRTLIIEDETISSNHIVDLLNNYCAETFIIEAEIESVLGAIKWFMNNDEPDLVFMDIHLSDGHSFEIFNKVDINCPIIFTTAYDEYAIKAFKTNSIDYLLKPITQEICDQAISKFLKLRRYHEKVGSLKINSVKTNKERFLVKLGNKYTPLKTEDIAYFYKDDIVFVRSFNGNSYPINSSLSTIENSISTSTFFRANRKIIININAIEYLAQYKPGQLTIKVSPKFEEIIVLSQERSCSLKSLLNCS